VFLAIDGNDYRPFRVGLCVPSNHSGVFCPWPDRTATGFYSWIRLCCFRWKSSESRACAGGINRSVSHRISYDSYSLKIDGKRIFLYSGEIHPYHLPSPSLWRDVLEKIKAAGFNGISVYSYWGYHSPSPGKYFTGIRTWIRSSILRMK
jgi:hypothetical protein